MGSLIIDLVGSRVIPSNKLNLVNDRSVQEMFAIHNVDS